MFKIIRFRKANNSGAILGNFDVQVGDSFILAELKLVKGKKNNFVAPPQKEYEDRNGDTKYAPMGFNFNYDDDNKKTEKSAELHDILLDLAEEAYENAPDEEPRRRSSRSKNNRNNRNDRDDSDDNDNSEKSESRKSASGGYSF